MCSPKEVDLELLFYVNQIKQIIYYIIDLRSQGKYLKNNKMFFIFDKRKNTPRVKVECEVNNQFNNRGVLKKTHI